MDAVDRDMKMVGLKRKMADDRRRWSRTIDYHWPQMTGGHSIVFTFRFITDE